MTPPPPLSQWQWTGNELSLIRPFTLLVTTDSPSVPPENQMVPQTFLHPPFPLPHPRSDTNSYALHSWWDCWSMVYQFFRPPDCCITIRTILCWTFLRIFAFIFISLRAGRNAISDHIRQKLSKDKKAVKYPTLTRSKKSKGRSMNATGDFITNKRAVFMQPHRRLPSHFEIHPEFESESRFINHFGTEKISWNIPLLVSNEQHCIILRSPALMTLFMRLIRC